MRTTVAIVGGGLAGLHAARLLHRAGIDLRLLEARDRLGGRILSAGVDGFEADDGFDLGPSWFWPDMQPSLASLVEELGLRSFPQYDAGDVLIDRDPHVQPQRYPGMPQDPAYMRLAGGMGALVRGLARDLPQQSLRLGVRTAGMTLGEAGVTLRIVRSDGGEETLTANQVIVAMPPRLLEVSVAFEPALPPEVARRWRDAATWMAPHAKFLASYGSALLARGRAVRHGAEHGRTASRDPRRDHGVGRGRPVRLRRRRGGPSSCPGRSRPDPDMPGPTRAALWSGGWKAIQDPPQGLGCRPVDGDHRRPAPRRASPDIGPVLDCRTVARPPGRRR
ncbi:hypothetical protein D9599_28630 [Roseomonas sp. KE2513]|nr:FAD-dependent oxidoreductase [Roseomonas sp. KE2513]MBI0539485.1 hypothetical protein [Roseomonas sp. KE2513]